MTPFKKAKKYGFTSMTQLSALSGWPRSTLDDMAKKYPSRYETVLLGCKAKLEMSGVYKPLGVSIFPQS